VYTTKISRFFGLRHGLRHHCAEVFSNRGASEAETVNG
jgi:hypothetical protein